MLGYALTDGRTGKATYYTGNLEESYMDSQGTLQIIEKKFIEKKWTGEMPVLYNFYGEASWLTPVLDSNGFLQNYFIVSAANPEISVFANSPNEALRLYKTALQRGGSTVDGSSRRRRRESFSYMSSVSIRNALVTPRSFRSLLMTGGTTSFPPKPFHWQSTSKKATVLQSRIMKRANYSCRLRK